MNWPQPRYWSLAPGPPGVLFTRVLSVQLTVFPGVRLGLSHWWHMGPHCLAEENGIQQWRPPVRPVTSQQAGGEAALCPRHFRGSTCSSPGPTVETQNRLHLHVRSQATVSRSAWV